MSDINAVDHLVAFYGIQARKREVIIFCSVLDTTRGEMSKIIIDNTDLTNEFGSILGVNTVNLLVTFYDIKGKRKASLFCPNHLKLKCN
jgi:hypothetical protein